MFVWYNEKQLAEAKATKFKFGKSANVLIPWLLLITGISWRDFCKDILYLHAKRGDNHFEVWNPDKLEHKFSLSID
jgi:hypothetical protein